MAGTGKYGVLSTALTWIRHDPAKRPPLKSREKWEREECDLRIGAITRDRPEAWKKEAVEEGDEITIRLLGPGMAEAPAKRFRKTKPKPAETTRTKRGRDGKEDGD